MGRALARNLAWSTGGAVAAALALFGASSCGPSAFEPASLINGVRILASSATEPYALPGDTVTVSVLTADGRNSPTPAATVSWIPIVCEDPPADLYYACFGTGLDGGVLLAADGAAPASAADGGDGGTTTEPVITSGFSSLPTGVDLTPFLPTGPTFTFSVPADAVTAHPPVAGIHPYGLVILFNAVCAGHLEFTAANNGGAQGGIPLGCYDANHVALDSDSFVFGLTRVYAYTDRTNANPVIDSLAYADMPLDPAVGVTMPHCTAAHDKDCPEQDFAVNVPESSWEVNPDDVDPSTGNARHEQIYAAYFATFGQLDSDIRLLYDPSSGKVTDTAETFRAPHVAGYGTMYVVVHDNRGGATWMSFPVHVT
jgi:hypothetical protein